MKKLLSLTIVFACLIIACSLTQPTPTAVPPSKAPPQANPTEPPTTSVLTPPQLTHVTTHRLPKGTHRPEILVTESGEIIVVVVQPEGAPGVGQIKHQAYRFDADWNQLGEPFVVTRNTAEYKAEDNFPDHCLLWLRDRLLVSPGANRKVKIREVDLDASVLATHIFDASPDTIPGEIGDSMLYDGKRLLVFSSGNPHDAAELAVSQLTGGFQRLRCVLPFAKGLPPGGGRDGVQQLRAALPVGAHQ